MSSKTRNLVPPLSNERVAVAILHLLKYATQSKSEHKLNIHDIICITQSSMSEVLEVFRVLNLAGMLNVSDESPNTTYTLNNPQLIATCEEQGWRDDQLCGRLELAYAGNGEFSLPGCRGQDSDLLWHGFIETTVSEAYDHQVSRITTKGRAAYQVLRLLFKRGTEYAKVA